MAALFIGTITGLVCAVFAAWLGASVLAIFCVYAISGIVGVLSYAVVLAVTDIDLTSKSGERHGLKPDVEDPQPRE